MSEDEAGDYMTGRDLLIWLSALSSEALDRGVYMEGCDCIGRAATASLDGDGDILIERKRGE